MDIDASGMIENYMNSKITAMLVNKLYGSSASVSGMPESTRRPFLSRMRLDSRVALQGAQNMEDAAAMVGAAQSNITAIKDKLSQMKQVATEASTKDGLSAHDYEIAQETLRGLAKDIVGIAKSSNFNDINLLDGSAGMNSDGKIQLQAGKSSREQVLVNVLNTAVGGGQAMDGNGNVNFNNLSGMMNVTNQADAKNVLAGLNDLFDRMEGVEAQYSYDIKSLKNMSILLQNQADILDNVQKNHNAPTDNGDSSSSSSSASSALSDLLGGGIMSAIS